MRMRMPSSHVVEGTNNAKAESNYQQQELSQVKPSLKMEEKNSKVNDPSQEQIYVVDEDTDVNDDVATQIKNLYGLMSRYSTNEI